MNLSTDKEIHSSYSANNIGDKIKEVILNYKPKKIIEFGVLDGYSTISMGQALKQLNDGGSITAYDLWEKYPYRHSTKEKVVENLKRYSVDEYVTLKDGDIFQWLDKQEQFDLIHVDISNDGQKIKQIYDKLKSNKKCKNSIMLFEGGTKERDEVDWMIKYNKQKIVPLSVSGEVPYKLVTNQFPGLSIIKF